MDKNFIVMTKFGWVGATNFSNEQEALKGLKYFLNKPEDKLSTVVDLSKESWDTKMLKADEERTGVRLITRLLRQGKVVDKDMLKWKNGEPVGVSEKSWDPTEFLRKPLQISHSANSNMVSKVLASYFTIIK